MEEKTWWIANNYLYFDDDLDALESMVPQLRKMIEQQIVMSDDPFPIRVGIKCTPRPGCTWGMIMEYRDREAWEKNDSDTTFFLFVLRIDTKKNWKAFAIHVYHLPVRDEYAVFAFYLGSINGFAEMLERTDDSMKVTLGVLADMDMNGVMENGKEVYVPMSDIFLKGEYYGDNKKYGLPVYRFEQQIRYETMRPGIDAPAEVCKRLLERKEWLAETWKTSTGKASALLYIPLGEKKKGGKE